MKFAFAVAAAVLLLHAAAAAAAATTTATAHSAFDGLYNVSAAVVLDSFGPTVAAGDEVLNVSALTNASLVVDAQPKFGETVHTTDGSCDASGLSSTAGYTHPNDNKFYEFNDQCPADYPYAYRPGTETPGLDYCCKHAKGGKINYCDPNCIPNVYTTCCSIIEDPGHANGNANKAQRSENCHNEDYKKCGNPPCADYGEEGPLLSRRDIMYSCSVVQDFRPYLPLYDRGKSGHLDNVAIAGGNIFPRGRQAIYLSLQDEKTPIHNIGQGRLEPQRGFSGGCIDTANIEDITETKSGLELKYDRFKNGGTQSNVMTGQMRGPEGFEYDDGKGQYGFTQSLMSEYPGVTLEDKSANGVKYQIYTYETRLDQGEFPLYVDHRAEYTQNMVDNCEYDTSGVRAVSLAVKTYRMGPANNCFNKHCLLGQSSSVTNINQANGEVASVYPANLLYKLINDDDVEALSLPPHGSRTKLGPCPLGDGDTHPETRLAHQVNHEHCNTLLDTAIATDKKVVQGHNRKGVLFKTFDSYSGDKVEGNGVWVPHALRMCMADPESRLDPAYEHSVTIEKAKEQCILMGDACKAVNCKQDKTMCGVSMSDKPFTLEREGVIMENHPACKDGDYKHVWQSVTSDVCYKGAKPNEKPTGDDMRCPEGCRRGGNTVMDVCYTKETANLQADKRETCHVGFSAPTCYVYKDTSHLNFRAIEVHTLNQINSEGFLNVLVRTSKELILFGPDCRGFDNVKYRNVAALALVGESVAEKSRRFLRNNPTENQEHHNHKDCKQHARTKMGYTAKAFDMCIITRDSTVTLGDSDVWNCPDHCTKIGGGNSGKCWDEVSNKPCRLTSGGYNPVKDKINRCVAINNGQKLEKDSHYYLHTQHAILSVTPLQGCFMLPGMCLDGSAPNNGKCVISDSKSSTQHAAINGMEHRCQPETDELAQAHRYRWRGHIFLVERDVDYGLRSSTQPDLSKFCEPIDTRKHDSNSHASCGTKSRDECNRDANCKLRSNQIRHTTRQYVFKGVAPVANYHYYDNTNKYYKDKFFETWMTLTEEEETTYRPKQRRETNDHSVCIQNDATPRFEIDRSGDKIKVSACYLAVASVEQKAMYTELKCECDPTFASKSVATFPISGKFITSECIWDKWSAKKVCDELYHRCWKKYPDNFVAECQNRIGLMCALDEKFGDRRMHSCGADKTERKFTSECKDTDCGCADETDHDRQYEAMHQLWTKEMELNSDNAGPYACVVAASNRYCRDRTTVRDNVKGIMDQRYCHKHGPNQANPTKPTNLDWCYENAAWGSKPPTELKDLEFYTTCNLHYSETECNTFGDGITYMISMQACGHMTLNKDNGFNNEATAFEYPHAQPVGWPNANPAGDEYVEAGLRPPTTTQGAARSRKEWIAAAKRAGGNDYLSMQHRWFSSVWAPDSPKPVKSKDASKLGPQLPWLAQQLMVATPDNFCARGARFNPDTEQCEFCAGAKDDKAMHRHMKMSPPGGQMHSLFPNIHETLFTQGSAMDYFGKVIDDLAPRATFCDETEQVVDVSHCVTGDFSGVSGLPPEVFGIDTRIGGGTENNKLFGGVSAKKFVWPLETDWMSELEQEAELARRCQQLCVLAGINCKMAYADIKSDEMCYLHMRGGGASTALPRCYTPKTLIKIGDGFCRGQDGKKSPYIVTETTSIGACEELCKKIGDCSAYAHSDNNKFCFVYGASLTASKDYSGAGLSRIEKKYTFHNGDGGGNTISKVEEAAGVQCYADPNGLQTKVKKVYLRSSAATHCRCGTQTVCNSQCDHGTANNKWPAAQLHEQCTSTDAPVRAPVHAGGGCVPCNKGSHPKVDAATATMVTACDGVIPGRCGFGYLCHLQEGRCVYNKAGLENRCKVHSIPDKCATDDACRTYTTNSGWAPCQPKPRHDGYCTWNGKLHTYQKPPRYTYRTEAKCVEACKASLLCFAATFLEYEKRHTADQIEKWEECYMHGRYTEQTIEKDHTFHQGDGFIEGVAITANPNVINEYYAVSCTKIDKTFTGCTSIKCNAISDNERDYSLSNDCKQNEWTGNCDFTCGANSQKVGSITCVNGVIANNAACNAACNQVMDTDHFTVNDNDANTCHSGLWEHGTKCEVTCKAAGSVARELTCLDGTISGAASGECFPASAEAAFRLRGRDCQGLRIVCTDDDDESCGYPCTDESHADHEIVMKNCPAMCSLARNEPCPTTIGVCQCPAVADTDTFTIDDACGNYTWDYGTECPFRCKTAAQEKTGSIKCQLGGNIVTTAQCTSVQNKCKMVEGTAEYTIVEADDNPCHNSEWMIGSYCKYTCNNGGTPGATIECKAGGIIDIADGDGVSPVCKKPCGEYTLEGGELYTLDDGTCKFDADVQTCEFTCSVDGATKEGHIRCNDGEVDDDARCTVKKCQKVDAGTNVNLQGACKTEEWSGECEYTCTDGKFTPQGKITCDAKTGEINDDSACTADKANPCNDKPEDANAYDLEASQSCSVKAQVWKHGDECNVKCKTGFTSSGAKLVCSNGKSKIEGGDELCTQDEDNAGGGAATGGGGGGGGVQAAASGSDDDGGGGAGAAIAVVAVVLLLGAGGLYVYRRRQSSQRGFGRPARSNKYESVRMSLLGPGPGR